MKKQKALLTCFLAISFAFSACQKSVVENENKQIDLPPPPSISPTLSSTPIPSQKSFSSARKIDFKNFTFSYPDKKIEEFFTLKNGEKERTEEEDGARLGKIEYGDVTNDNVEEALLRIAPDTGGNCQCEMAYIYTLENKKPKLLWSFDTWDRADGGLKRIYAENGELVVETFGDNKFENDEWEFNLPKEGAGGLCCPTAYTKIHFKWNGEKFIVQGKPELFDYDWKNQQIKN